MVVVVRRTNLFFSEKLKSAICICNIYFILLQFWYTPKYCQVEKTLQRPICNNLHLQVRGPIFFELSQGCGILTNDEIGKQDIIKKSATRNQNKKDDDKWKFYTIVSCFQDPWTQVPSHNLKQGQCLEEVLIVYEYVHISCMKNVDKNNAL